MLGLRIALEGTIGAGLSYRLVALLPGLIWYVHHNDFGYSLGFVLLFIFSSACAIGLIADTLRLARQLTRRISN